MSDEDRTDWWGEPAATDRDLRRANELVTRIERDAPWLGGPFHVQHALAERIALALAQERRRAGRQALLDAADWLDRDVDEEGPSYHIDGLAWYDGPAWAAAHLRARAEAEQ